MEHSSALSCSLKSFDMFILIRCLVWVFIAWISTARRAVSFMDLIMSFTAWNSS